MTTLPADGLVGRLRDDYENWSLGGTGPELLRQAADAIFTQAATIEAQAAELSSLRAKLAEAMDVVDAAKGLCFGEDWNKGSHAIKHGYRAKLISAIGKMFPDHPCAARRLIEGGGK